MKPAKKLHYVDNTKFYEAILEHKRKVKEFEEKGLEKPRIPNYIGECIWNIANRLSTKPCFMGYSFRDDMIGDAVENCILYFDDYNPDIGKNPFAYFTQIIYYAFLRRINKEQKNRYIIYKNFQETIINNGHESLLTDSDDNHLLSVSMYDNISVFMSKFEEKEREKKEKRKKVKEGLARFIEE
jgi:hypothetical protein